MPKTRRMTPRARKEVDTSTYSGRFAVRLRALRDKTGMSVEAFVEMHGFNRTTWYSWEHGYATPSFDKLPDIAKAFGISVRTLIPKE